VVCAPHVRGLCAVPTVKMIDVIFASCTTTLLSFVLSLYFPLSRLCHDDILLRRRFGVRSCRCRARAGSRMFSPPETSAVPARDAPPRAHPLPTLTDRSRFPVPHGRSNTLYSEGAQPNLSAHRAVRAVDVLRPRSSLLFPAPPLPHVAPPPLSLHMPSCIHTSLCAPATGPAHHSPSHGASAQHGGSLGGSRGGSQGSSHA
jgi:hypothetical protein